MISRGALLRSALALSFIRPAQAAVGDQLAEAGGQLDQTHALTREMEAQPGSRMIHSTGARHVLGAALTEGLGDSLLTQIGRHLGRPLGIDVAPSTRDPQGSYMSDYEMALTPRAMLRVAGMMRNGGRHGDTQVISADRVARSTGPLTRSP